MDEISRTEILIGVIVVLAVVALAIFLNPVIKAGMLDELKIYQQSAKIENDPVVFSYAHKTGAGDVLAYGEFTAIHPKGFPELTETYAMVVRKAERYSMHTRQVCASRDKKGNCTSYRTEIYYTWDYAGNEARTSEMFLFLGEEFAEDQLSLSAFESIPVSKDTIVSDRHSKIGWGYLYDKSPIWHSVGDLRYSYGGIPTKFFASTLMRFSDGKVLNPVNGSGMVLVFYKQKPDDIVNSKEKFIRTVDWIYYPGFLLVGAGLYFGLAYKVLQID